MELDVGNSTESFQRFLESQKELFHNQIDQLQKIVVTQCKLTGVNPLAQEMAAGALSIKIGKRPRDLLNPKAVKYMQSVFSIKDTINKKETREISALCGVTVTQVRELFAGYRSRVRKLVRLSREKAVKSSTCPLDACSVKPESSAPSSHDVPLNSVDPNNLKEEEPSGSSPEETFPGIDSYEKNFVENIFNLMRKVETFSGQVELMEWVLQIHNTSILNWFLTKGGIMILATWLGLAAIEEQTTVLLVILKVLSHLPLHRALPVQMSAILQTVNKLRFYRTADISNRARVLLSRLSKLFVRSQTVKDAQKEMIRKQRISEILSDESWHSKIDFPEELLALTCGGSECSSKLEHMPAHSDSNKKSVRGSSINTRERRKILMVEQPSRSAGRNVQVARVSPVKQSRPMSADDIQKAKLRALFMQSKYGKTGASSKEIIQHKIRNSRVTSDRSEIMKVSSLQTSSAVLLASKTVQLKTESDSKPVSLSSSVSLSESLLDPKPTVPQKSVVQLNSSSPKPSSSPQKQNSIRNSALQNLNVEPSAVSHQPKSKSSVTFAEPDPKSISAPQEDPLLEKLKRDKIPWHTPPEMRINPGWSLGTGENSKEVEVQTERIRRERETIYPNTHGIPSDPKDPWDIEMDYDDSLTPEIPTEQPPEADIVEVNSPCSSITVTVEVNSPCSNTTVTAATSSGAASNADPEPDLELLAVLLNNPDLVFALTSGQRGNISSAEMVQVLDMIKASGVGLAGSVNGVAGNAAEVPRSVISSSLTPLPSPIPMSLPSPTPMSLPSPTPVSLPSPTPHSTVTEWRLGSASTPKVPQMSSHSQSALQVTFGAVSSNPSLTATPGNSEIHQIPTTISTMRQLPAGFSSLQTPSATTILPSQTLPTTLWESQSPPVVTLSQLPHDRHNKFSAQRAFNSPLSTVPATVQQILVPQLETRDLGRTSNPKSASASTVVNHPGVDRAITTFSSTPLFVPPKQPSLLPEPMAVLPSYSPWSGNAPSIGVREFMPGTSRPNGFLDNRAPNPHVPASQSKYNSYPVGPVQTPLHPGPVREGNEYNTRAPEFETWSSESDQEYELDRNFHGQRRDSGRAHIRSEWPRHPRHSGHHRDHRPSNRRWRDRDRRH